MTSDDLLKLAGIRPDMRENAREAARLQGMTLNEWLRSLIAKAAQDVPRAAAASGQEAPRRSRRVRSEPRVSEAEKNMQDISARLERLTDRLADLPPPAPPIAPAQPPHRSAIDAQADELSRALQAIEARISTLGPTSPPPPEPPRFDAPYRPLREEAPSPTAPRRAAEKANDPWSFGLDSAIAEIAERQRALDEPEPEEALNDQFAALSQRLDQPAYQRTRESVHAADDHSALRDQMRELTQELRTARPNANFESTLNALRTELAEISRQLSDAAPRRAMQAVEAQVRTLADRVDEQRLSGRDSSALDAVVSGIADIRGALSHFAPAESLAAFRDEVRKLDRKIEMLASGTQGHSPNALRSLEQAISELKTVASHAASGEALIALAEEVQKISQRTDRILAATVERESRVSTMIEQRFQELADHLNGQQRSSAVSSQGQIDQVVNALEAKLNRSGTGLETSPMLDAIALQLDKIASRLDASDAKVSQLEYVERSFGDLIGRVDTLQDRAVAAAKEAAMEAAPRPEVAELGILRKDLNALQMSQLQSDRRTQETLATVHNTLSKLVDRLPVVPSSFAQTTAPAASALQAPARPSATPPMAAPPAPPAPRPVIAAEPPPLAARREPSPELEWRAAPKAPVAAPPASPSPVRQDSASLPADFPLEPDAPTIREPVSAVATTARGDNSKANFIAAARRAAQVATETGEKDATAEAERSGGSAFSALARKLTGRSALMIAALLLAGIGVLHATLSSNEPITPLMPETKRVATTAIPPASRTPAPKAQPAQPPVAAVAPAPALDPIQPTAATAPAPEASPWSVAAFQSPTTNDLTSTVSRATGLGRSAPAATPVPSAPTELSDAMPRGLRTAAVGGNPAAEYEVGVRYAEGRGVPVNYEEAARWFERAANRNLAPAQYRLGSLYEKGNGVKKDTDQARRLYRAAADAGNAKAMHNLAVLYAEGIEGKPDFRNAAEWFRQAAMRGIADSQYNAAILYARGLGVEQNLAESYKWFALAAQQGDQDSAKKRDDVAARLETAHLTAAQQAVQAFKPMPQPDEAVTVTQPAGGWEADAAPVKPKGGSPRRRSTAT